MKESETRVSRVLSIRIHKADLAALAAVARANERAVGQEARLAIKRHVRQQENREASK